MRLRIVAFGKLKTPGLRESADYYSRLIRPWIRLEEEELKPLPVPDKSPATRLLIQQKESELLLQKLGSAAEGRGAFYLLDETGTQWTTREWAHHVRTWESEGLTELAFCIGSSLGFHENIKARARGKVSLGPQTLPHELARIVLLEQLYRAWSVVRGHPYHNEG